MGTQPCSSWVRLSEHFMNVLAIMTCLSVPHGRMVSVIHLNTYLDHNIVEEKVYKRVSKIANQNEFAALLHKYRKWSSRDKPASLVWTFGPDLLSSVVSSNEFGAKKKKFPYHHGV